MASLDGLTLPCLAGTQPHCPQDIPFTKMDGSPSILVGFEHEMAQNLPPLSQLFISAINTLASHLHSELQQHEDEEEEMDQSNSGAAVAMESMSDSHC